MHSDSDRKLFAAAQARAALHDITLERTEDDAGRPTFIASRGAVTLRFPQFANVNAWLARLGTDTTSPEVAP